MGCYSIRVVINIYLNRDLNICNMIAALLRKISCYVKAKFGDLYPRGTQRHYYENKGVQGYIHGIMAGCAHKYDEE